MMRALDFLYFEGLGTKIKYQCYVNQCTKYFFPKPIHELSAKVEIQKLVEVIDYLINSNLFIVRRLARFKK